MNKTRGVELEIRKDDGSTIMVVQKQGSTRFSAGQRVVLASNGSRYRFSALIHKRMWLPGRILYK